MRILQSLFLPLLSSAAASAQIDTGVPPSFAHDALSCMSTSDFPVVEAELDSAERRGLRNAQVYFKAGGTESWYFVEMTPGEGSRLHAILPRPLAETDRVDYYLFFLSASFEPAQTPEYSVRVSEEGCGTSPQTLGSPASIALRATVANQPPVPPGFSPQGISSLLTTSGNSVSIGSAAAGGGSASGGVSGVTIGAIAGGGAAAAGAAVAVTGGDKNADTPTSAPDPAPDPTGGGVEPTSTPPSPEPTPPPNPTPPPPPPSPSLPDISGTWLVDYRITGSCDPSLVGRTSTTPMEVRQNGTAVSASRNGPNFTENLAGTIDTAGNIALRGSFVDESETGEARIEATTSSGSDMSGRYVRIYPEHNCTIRWAFSGSKS